MNSRFTTVLVALVAGCAPPRAAHAVDAELSPVVISATRSAEPSLELPAAIDVVDAILCIIFFDEDCR